MAAPAPIRDDSIDLLRGSVMVLMALDHARDFLGDDAVSPTDLAHTNVALFFTRWVTHFCAPVFVLLAGVSAYMASSRRTPGQASLMLLTRGLWLVLLELTVVRFGWMFDLTYQFSFVQVIWAIGWSMVALALISRAGPRAALVLGVAMIVAHDLLDGVHAASFGSFAWLWHVLHETGRIEPFAGHRVYVAYPLVPWIGVMAAGYGLGPWLAQPTPQRRTLLLRLGALLTLAFVVLRALDGYGDVAPWQLQSRPGFTALAFLACSKYPPSLDYLLMTLGPALFLWGLASGRDLSRVRGVITYGRVPLFFYVLHLPLLHLLAYAWLFFRGGRAAIAAAADSDHGTGGSLTVVYGGWVLALALLWPLCRWLEGVKARHRGAWWAPYV